MGCLQFFVAEQVARLGWSGHYAMRENMISDLGAVRCARYCSHLHAVMNGSFFLQSLLIAAGALLLPRKTAGGWTGIPARAALLVAAFALWRVAMVPVDTDTGSHVASASLYFVASALAMVLWGVSQAFQYHSLRGSEGVTLVFAAIAIFGDWALVSGTGVRQALGAGTVERFAAYPFTVWLVWTGVRALRRREAAV